MRRPLVAGKLKMHGTRQSVDSLLKGFNQQELAGRRGCHDRLRQRCIFSASFEALAKSSVYIGAQSCAHQPSLVL